MEIKKISLEKTEEKGAFFQLTRRCNNNCPHCYINLPLTAKTKELTVKNWCTIIDQLIANKFNQIIFTGGEPTVYPGFKEIYLYAKKKGLSITLMTNATNFDEATKNMLYTFPPKELHTTIYGIDEATYSKVTGNPRGWQEFSKNMLFFEKLKKDKGVFLSCMFMITKDTIKFLGEIKNFTSKYGFENITYGRSLFSRLDGDVIRNKMIESKRLNDFDQRAILLGSEVNGEFFPATFVPPENPPHQELFACKLDEIHSPYFFEDGTLTLCCLLYDEKYSLKLTEEDFRNFNYKEAREKLHKKLSSVLNLKINNKCALCTLRNSCYSCPAKNLLDKTDIFGYNKKLCIKDLLAFKKE